VTDACPAPDIMTHIRRITAVLVTPADALVGR
jgi:hypothetical protein